MQPTLWNSTAGQFTHPEHLVGSIVVFEYFQHDAGGFLKAFVFVGSTQARLLASIMRHATGNGLTGMPPAVKSSCTVSFIPNIRGKRNGLKRSADNEISRYREAGRLMGFIVFRPVSICG